jgi:Mg2+ and Co2+ transporter CorA
MGEEFGLHELPVEDARHGHPRPKIEECVNSLFAVLQTVEIKDAELEVGEVDIFVGTNDIFPVRLHTERGLAEAIAIFRSSVRWRLKLEQIEEQIFLRNTARSNIEALYALKRSLMIQARRRCADGSGQQALRRKGPADLRRHGRVFPRCVRSPAAAARDDRRRYATCRPRPFRSTSA